MSRGLDFLAICGFIDAIYFCSIWIFPNTTGSQAAQNFNCYSNVPQESIHQTMAILWCHSNCRICTCCFCYATSNSIFGNYITIPEYTPFFQNPTINPAIADPSVISPGLPLKGQYVLIPLMTITLLLNIIAEELYFRAWILPKLSKYGAFSWVINAVLFAFYHTFQLWLLPVILVGSLIWALVIYQSKSIWPALAGHLVGNLIFSMLGMIMMILG